jgi:hypothetical protein
MNTLAIILAIIFFVAGVTGSVLPVLPGAVLIWLGMLIYGFLTKFDTLSSVFYIGQALAVLLVYLIDHLAGVWGVKRYGGSRSAIYGSLIGTFSGLVLLGPAGIIFGPFVGAVAGELINKKTLVTAVRSGIGTMVGLLGGSLLKLAIEIIMIIWFFWVVYH